MDGSHQREQDFTREFNKKDCKLQRNSPSLSDDDVCIIGEISSRRDDTGSLSNQSERESHLMGCSYHHTNICFCKDIISIEKRRAKLSSMSFKDNSLSGSAHSSILAGRFADIQSRSSSETSYYSAQTYPVNDKQITSETSSTSSNYSTDKWNKNIETSSDLPDNNNTTKETSSTSSQTSQDTSHDKNISHEKTCVEIRDTNYNLEYHNHSITSINKVQKSNDNDDDENLIKDNNDNEKPVVMNSFLKKLIKVIDAPVQDDSIKPTEFFSRLSQSYIGNTDNFKRKLMTIMEENSMGQDSTNNNELNNLTKKFVGICQYIQDESMPSMMLGSSLLNMTNNPISEIHLTPKCSPIKKIRVQTNQNSSPLYKTVLSNNATPIKSKYDQFNLTCSPGTPDSFIRLEKYCEQNATPTSAKKLNLHRSLSVPDFAVWTAKEEFLKKCKDQEKSLEDTIQAVKVTDDITNLSFDTFESHSRRVPSSDLEYHSINSSILDDEDDLTRTIMIEAAKKRQRCYETEKTIREIDAASNASSETSGTFESEKILEMFELIKKSEDYYNYLTKHKDTIRSVTKRLSFDSGVDLSSKTPDIKSPKKRIIKNYESNRKIKPTKAVTPRTKSPVYSTEIKSVKKINNNLKIPGQKLLASTPQSIQQLRSVSNCDSPSLSCSSKPSSTLDKFNYRKVPIRSATKQKNSISPISPSIEARKKPTPLSSPFINSRSPAINTTPKPYLVPTTKITSCTPRKNDLIISQSPRQPSSMTTPINDNTQTTKRRFFITPNKSNPSPLPRPRINKPKNYFSGLDDVYGFKTVKSPVAEYIRGTDTQLVQNIRARKNSFLLTPRSNSKAPDTSFDDLKFKLNKNDNSPANYNTISSPVLQHQANMMLAENEENIPIDFHLPQTNYEMPAEIHEIIGSPSKIRGARSRLLKEVNERKVVTRHEGRVAPSFVDSLDEDMAEMSIHITNHANKTNYAGHLRRVKD